MGGTYSAPNYETLESIPLQTCYKLNSTGLSFTHMHSFFPASSFFQSLNIRPRIFPRGDPRDEFSPGDYRFGFNSEMEGIQFNTKVDSQSIDCSAKLPFNDDFTFELSSSLHPVFILSASAQCHTNIINTTLSFSNIDFQHFNSRASLVVQCTDSLLVGATLQYTSQARQILNSLTSSYQRGNFVFSFSRDLSSNKIFSAKYFLNPSSFIGLMSITEAASKASLFGLGYSFALGNSIAQGSITSDLQVTGKITKQISPEFVFGAGLSADLINNIYNFNIDIQLQTGEQTI